MLLDWEKVLSLMIEGTHWQEVQLIVPTADGGHRLVPVRTKQLHLWGAPAHLAAHVGAVNDREVAGAAPGTLLLEGRDDRGAWFVLRDVPWNEFKDSVGRIHQIHPFVFPVHNLAA